MDITESGLRETTNLGVAEPAEHLRGVYFFCSCRAPFLATPAP